LSASKPASTPSQPAGAARRVAVFTDSTTYVPAELYDRLGVHRVSLYVGWDGEMEPEDSWTDLGAFYRRLRESATLPTTSQPSVGDFEAAYLPVLESGHDIVSIHIASGISGTCDSAREAARSLAARGVEGRIEVVDGQTGAGPLGCMVLAAASSAGVGADADAVAAEARRTRESLAMWFCLDTLEYLRRGGRIGAAQALLGSALKVKPILTFGTEITPVDKVRTKGRAMQRMESYLGELHDRGATDWIVQHAQSPDDATWLSERGEAILGKPPLFCTEVGPVLGAHLGAGILLGGIGLAPAADGD
jgi:DegV family protein with EDD domain